MPTVIRLTAPPSIVREFKRKAKEAFPRETFCFLLGGLDGDRAYVAELYFPEDVRDYSTVKGFSEVPEHWATEAMDRAEEVDLAVIGTAHSHPYKFTGHLGDRAHSEDDHDALITRSISGICVVQKGKTGKLRASMRFWGPAVAVEMKA